MFEPVAETSDQRPRRIGIAILILTFGVFGMWSMVAPLQSAALAPGTVTVKGSRKSIEHLEGGIVAEIAVKDGDSVAKGELLVRLDDTQMRAQLEIAMGQYFAVKSREARLLGERDGVEEVSYPAAIANDDDPRARDAIYSQNQVFMARRAARLGENEVLEQRIQQLEAQVRGSEAMRAGKQKLTQSYTEEIKDFSELLEQGFADKQRLRELERSLAQTEGEVAQYRSDIARLQIQVGETRLQILQLQKDFHTEVVDELGATQIDVYDLDERVRALTDTTDRTDIRAPASGIVVGLTVTTIGEVVVPGEPLLFIVPQQVELIVEAQVSPVDIDRVHKGQLADIRFSSFKSTTTPVIEGTIIGLSADALTPPDPAAPPYYLARVEVSEEGYALLDDLILVPGMPAEVLINTGSRTLFQYLTQPIRNAFARSLIED